MPSCKLGVVRAVDAVVRAGYHRWRGWWHFECRDEKLVREGIGRAGVRMCVPIRAVGVPADRVIDGGVVVSVAANVSPISSQSLRFHGQ